MGVELRTTLLATVAMALFGCGESFTSDGPVGGGGSEGTAGSGAAPTSSAGGGGSGSGGDTGGSGGAGGPTCDPSDDDGDGFSECDGDCDDADPAVSPGALEICGDDVDGNCDGASDADPPCNGIGTFVSEQTGSVGATGTAADPVATITEGIDKAKQIGVPTAVLVAAGSYTEALVIEKRVSLVGGFDPESWATRDPAVHTTTLKCTSFEGLRVVGAEPSVIVDGFIIQGRNVQAGTDTSCAVTIDGGSPTLSTNVILAGAVGVGPGASIGVRVVDEAALGEAAKLSDNSITAGPSTLGPTYGVLIDTQSSEVDLVGNDVKAGSGADSVALMIVESTGVSATGRNTFQSGAAKGSATPSTSLGVWAQKGPFTFDSNLVNPNQVQDPPDCATPDVWCGGVRVSTPDAKITNNILSGAASSRSAGLHLLETNGSLEGVIVNSNLILGGGHGGPGTRSAVILLGAPVPDSGFTNPVGRFRNNILFGGLAENNYGFYEQHDPGEPCQPAALDHNLFFFPIEVPNKGVLYSDWSGGAVFTISNLDALPGDGDNLQGDPFLANNHLTPGSPCRNAGTDEEAPDLDRDQDPRPAEGSFDIGPDEWVP